MPVGGVDGDRMARDPEVAQEARRLGRHLGISCSVWYTLCGALL
jgi:hypothetical protein